MVLGFVEQRPGLAKLVEDDRIYNVIEDLLGPDFVWITSDGNLYVGDTEWHPDASLPTYHLIKIAFYLDPVRKDSGCLRVIRGSHREPFHSVLKSLRKLRSTPPEYPFGVAGAEVPAYPLRSDPGDVALHKRLYDGDLRHQLTNPYAAKDNVYGPDFLTTDSPRRHAMVRQLVEWGFK